MQGLSLYYRFLRRWGIMLLLGMGLGGLAGFGYVEEYRQPEFEMSARLVNNVNKKGLDFKVLSGIHASSTSAGKSIVALTSRLESDTGTRIEIRDLKIIKYRTEGWGKIVVLGSVLGVLAVVAVIFVWEEVQSQSRRQQETSSL